MYLHTTRTVSVKCVRTKHAERPGGLDAQRTIHRHHRAEIDKVLEREATVVLRTEHSEDLVAERIVLEYDRNTIQPVR